MLANLHFRPALRLLASLFLLLSALTAAVPGFAARLVPDKTEIAVGETIFVGLDADLVLMADWSAGPELEILDSSSKGATVKGVKAGKTRLTVKYLGGKKSAQIVVLPVRPSADALPEQPATPVTQGPAVPAYAQKPITETLPPLPAAGDVLFARTAEPTSSANVEVFQALNELARSDRPIDLGQAREFFRRVQASTGRDGNVWDTLRAVKRANKAQWDTVQGVENQLVALVRDTLVRGRESIIRRGNLGTVFAILDSGKWRNRAVGDLFFDTDFDTTFFADKLAEVDPDGRDNIISRVEDMLAQQLGVRSKHLGIELTGYGYESQGDNYVSKTGIKWALRESASHIHLIDPATGRIGPNIHNHANVLFARQQQAALRLRHPELFDVNGRLLPNISRVEVRRILEAEPGLSRSERMFAEGVRMNVTDAALAPIDMACHLSETRQSTGTAEDIAKISKQVARSSAVFIEGMGGPGVADGPFTPAELEFMRLTRQLETAKIERAAAEAQVARFMAENPASTTYSEAQIAELDRLLEQARTQKTLVERSLSELQSRWSLGGVHETALRVLKKQARSGFDASLRDMLLRPATERTRALGDFAREMEILTRHYENKGAPAEMLQWARQGLETSLILHEMSRDARFSELWAAFERMGRAGPREVARLKEFLGQSEAGRRLLDRVGIALDNIANPPKEEILGHPMAEASRSLREIAGSYTALVGHTALLVGLVDSAYQAKTNEEFAASLAHTLVGTTTVGLILQEGQQLILGGDPKAGARLVAYLLIPETMLPALVEALGHSTINLGTAIAFDTQLDALYLVSKFDKNGGLTEIGGYPRGQLAEMLEDILGTGGYRTLEDMVNRAVKDSDNFFAEQAKGINEQMKRTVVSALNKTFLVGTQMVFRDDATLSAIAGNVRKYQDEISYLAKTFGIEAPLGDTPLGPSAFTATAADFYPGAHDPRTLTALDPKGTKGRTPIAPHWASTLDRGQLRALAQLFVTRDWWGNEARKAFIATLIRTLEERHRAEQDVDADLRDQKRKELMALFAELDITEQGTEAYNQEAGYHLVKHVWNVTLGFATKREQAVHEMKALNRYLDVYRHVRDLRFAIEAEVTRRTGRTATPRPLTSIPALTAVPAIDYPASDNLAREIGQLGDELSRTLTLIKGAPLEGDYDSTMFKRIYEAKYQHAYWVEARKSTVALKEQVAGWKIVAKIDLDLLRQDCYRQSSAAWDLAEELIEEFRNYYANQAVQGDIRITPADLTEGDPFQATLTLRKGVMPKGATWTWQGGGGVTVQGSGESARGVATTSGQVRARLTSAEGKTLADLSAEVIVKPKPKDDGQKPPGDDGGGSGGGGGSDGIGQSGPSGDGKITFGASAGDNWDMETTEKGVKFTRKVAQTKGACGWNSTVTASVTATFRRISWDENGLQKAIAETRAKLDKQKAERKIGCASPDMSVGLFKAGGLDAVGSIALGEFQGGIIDFPNWVRRGSGGWMTGYTGSWMVACGNGAVHGKAGSIEFSYSANGGGCWDNSDRAYLVRQVLAAQKEARALIASLRPGGDGLKQDAYKGPKYDGSDNPTVKLLPEQLARLKVGDIATVEAVVENAEPEDPPYTYAWDGTFHGKAEDLKKSATVTLNPEKPGKYKVGVSVTGQRFGMGYASLEYEVADVKVAVERVPAGNAPVPVGGKVRFKAVLTIDGKPASGNYIYRWQPNTELQFSATESARAVETTATFTQLGKQKLWVEVLERKGATESTVGDSDRLEIEVIEPKLSLSVEPKEPLVGKETRVTLKDEPRLDDKVAGFRWEHKGAVLNSGPTRDERVFTFKPKDAKPVTVKARGYLRDDNTHLGEAEITLQPRAYDVKLGAPQARGPRPQVWKCDTQLGGAAGCGLVDLPQGQFVTFQDITIPSSVTPRPDSPRYRWTVDPSGSCGLPTSGSELRLNCSNTGSYTVRLEVNDADGVQLGTAETSVTVSVSQDKVDTDKTKAQATQKLNEAKQLWNQGRHDEAVAAAEAAAQADKTLAQPVLNEFSRGLKQQGWDALHKGERDTALKKLEQAARLNPNDADAQKKLADARDHVAKWPQVEAKVRQFDEHIASKRVWSAQRTMLEMQDILRTMAAGQSGNNPTWKQVMDDFNKGLQDYNRFTQEKSARHTQYFKEENYPEMLRNAESMREWELSPADERECQSRIDFAKRYLRAAEFGRQAQELTRQGRHEDALRAIEQGREIDYKQVKAAAEELSTTLKQLGKAALDKRDFATAARHYALALRVNPQDGEAIGGDVSAKQFQKYADQLRAWQREIEGHIQRGDWDKSESRLQELDRLEALLPGERYPESLSLHARQTEGYAAYKDWVEPLKRDVGRFLNKQCLDKAEAKIMEMRARHLIWMDQDWTRVFLDSIAESRRTCSSGNVPLKNNCGRDCGLVNDPPDSTFSSVSGSRVMANNREMITLDNLDIRKARAIRLEIEEVSARSAAGAADSARVGEVEFWSGNRQIKPHRVSAESTYPEYGAEQANDGDRQYRYRSQGARGWASAEKARQQPTWLRFDFAHPVDVDRVVVTTAPSDPYRLHTFHLRSLADTGVVGVTATVAGTWKSTEGTLTLQQNGGQVSGSYTQDGGRVVGELKGNLLEGYWSENGSPERCATAREGRHHWGRIRWVFDGDRFVGGWTYCDRAVPVDSKNWTGERIGKTPPPDQPPEPGADLGAWQLDANGWIGPLELSGGCAMLHLGGGWETLTGFSHSGNTVRFTRPLSGATQRYTGTMSGDAIQGTFTQEGTSTLYKWSAKRQGTASGAPCPEAKPGVRDDPSQGNAGTPTPSDYYHVDLTPHGGKKGTPRKAKEIEVDDGSWIRLKATHEKRLFLDIPLPAPVTANGVAVVTNLDNAHHLPDNARITTLTVRTTAGDHRFDFRAGVHSSEWNRGETGGADHKFPKDNHLGGSRWLATFTLPAGSRVTGLRFDYVQPERKHYHGDAAPGFVIRGITLLGKAVGGDTGSTGNIGDQGTTLTSAGLIAAYPLDGDARDTSGNARHGTPRGATPTADRFGQANRAMRFDGKSYIDLPLDINPSAQPKLTFTAWVRADETNPTRQVMSHDDGGYDRSLGIDPRGGGSGWSLFTGSGNVLGFKPVEKGRWTFVAGVWDQTARTARLHVDGQVLERKETVTGNGHKGTQLGRNPSYGEFFVGAIDDVRFYDRPLSPPEIEALRAGQALSGGSAQEDTGTGSSRQASLTPDKTQYAAGETVTLRFSGIAKPAAQDWIGLYPVGAKNEQYGEWHYLKGQASGTLPFKVPAPGEYEFRLFLNWPAGGYQDVARSAAIRVPPKGEVVPTPPGGGATVAAPDASRGHWRLVDSRMEKKTGSDCYPAEISGVPGDLNVRIGSVCGEKGHVLVRARWTQPPQTIAAGERLRMETSLSATIHNTNRGLAAHIDVDLDDHHIQCGYTRGGGRIIETYSAGVGKAGGERRGEATMPSVDKIPAKSNGRIRLRVCSNYWHQYYYYQWQPSKAGGGTGAGTSVATPVPGERDDSAPGGVIRLAPDKTAYAPGEAIQLRFSGIATPAAKDWIGLYVSGAKNEQYGEWHYLNGQAAGTQPFKAPGAGEYEFRLFLNWPAGGYKDIARSATIRVASSGGSGPPPPSGGASLSLDKTVFQPGEPIQVRFSTPAGWPGDAWVGIVPSHVPHGDERQNDNHDITYQHLDKRTGGTLTFTAPGAGSWDLRLHDTDNGGKEFASVSFQVGTTAPAAGGRDYTGASADGGPDGAPGNLTGAAGGPEATFQGHRYRAVPAPNGITWAEADRAARALGGYLATVGSAAENDAIYGLVRTDDSLWYRDRYGNGLGPWLGGLQAIGASEPRGGWRWVSDEPFVYTSWASGEPNNSGNAEDRLHLFGPGALKGPYWNDLGGNNASVRGYVVEFGEPAPAPPSAPGKAAVLFDNGNIGGVDNGPRQPTRFSLSAPHVITLIQDYHWNYGRGATPGSIALRDDQGRLYGPWPVGGSPGQGGVPNAYWTARPGVTLPAGTFTVEDSDPASWAHNGQSGNRGFTRVEGYPAGSGPAYESRSYPTGEPVSPTPGQDKVDDTMKKVDDTLKKLDKFFEIFK